MSREIQPGDYVLFRRLCGDGVAVNKVTGTAGGGVRTEAGFVISENIVLSGSEDVCKFLAEEYGRLDREQNSQERSLRNKFSALRDAALAAARRIAEEDSAPKKAAA